MGDQGWTLGPAGDPILAKAQLYEVYLAHQSDYTGRASVPVLWDRHTQRIVTNESSDIVRDLDGAFDEFGDASRSFFPAGDEALARDLK